MLKPVLPILAALAGLGVALPVAAQQNDKQLIIYGNDRCPEGTVCIRAPESERFRIPQTLRSGPLAPSQQPWAARAASVANAGAASGGGSCSAAGAGVFTGCLHQEIQAWHNDRQSQAAATANSAEPR